MASRMVIREESALPNRMKLTVLSQEVIRRERNTSRLVDLNVRHEIRNKFMMKLRKSGYGPKQRVKIMLSGLRGYYWMCENEDIGGRRINQTRSEGASVRRIKKTIGKTNWF